MKANERVYENVTNQRKKTMSRIRGKDTSIEIKLRKELWKRGYRYRKNYKGLPGSPDICLTKYKIAIFCDSEFFHGKEWEVIRPKVEKGNNGTYWVKKIQENINRDNEVDKKLNFLGWTVIHFWGKDILKNLEDCIKVVEEVIFDIKLGEM
jgi:DNA mismatch endonuclease, patch repair protein